MLEIPESYTIAKQLRKAVIGKTIAQVETASKPHSFAWYFGDPAQYHDLLAGETVTGASGFGMYVELELGEQRFVVGDGTNLRFYTAEEKLPPAHQLHIGFTDGCSLRCTVQMYGGMWAFPDGVNKDKYYLGAKAAISPLSEAFDSTYFASLLTDKTAKLSAKAFLATEQRIPGLGNGVLQDILWKTGIHPKRKMNTLSNDEFSVLFEVLKATIEDMTKCGGRNTERDLFGHKGGYVTTMSKNNVDMPCPKCGDNIKRFAYLGGNVYVCDTCQPLI